MMKMHLDQVGLTRPFFISFEIMGAGIPVYA
jgi:hypothetical protein